MWLINVEHNPSIIICCESPIWDNLYCWSQFTKINVACKFLSYIYHRISPGPWADADPAESRWRNPAGVKSFISRIWFLCRIWIRERESSVVFWGVRYRVWVNPESAWSQVMTVVSSPRLMLSLSHPQFRHYQGWYHHPHYAPIKPRVTTTIIF